MLLPSTIISITLFSFFIFIVSRMLCVRMLPECIVDCDSRCSVDWLFFADDAQSVLGRHCFRWSATETRRSVHTANALICVSLALALSLALFLSLSLSFLFFLLFLSITLSIFLNFYPFTDFCMTFLALSAISSHNYQIFPAWPLNDRFVIVSDFQYPCLLCLLFSSFFLALFGCP